VLASCCGCFTPEERTLISVEEMRSSEDSASNVNHPQMCTKELTDFMKYGFFEWQEVV
jgi:hypothetical protein